MLPQRQRQAWASGIAFNSCCTMCTDMGLSMTMMKKTTSYFSRIKELVRGCLFFPKVLLSVHDACIGRLNTNSLKPTCPSVIFSLAFSTEISQESAAYAVCDL